MTSRLIQQLIHWYRRSKRDLPWRKTKDPYKIMVSEFMLVQTTVATVVPRYQQFLKEFPTLQSLAQAPLWKVKSAWKGLGYYSRAFNLWRACQRIGKLGRWPALPHELKTLPGFGPYLAGAVSSIAFEVPTPVIDANVKRVLVRVFESDDPGILESLLASSNFPPSEFTQAFMEMGALICKPANPQCGLCPMKAFCLTQGPHPSEKRKTQNQKLELLINVSRDGHGRFRLTRRGNNDLFLKNGWGLPSQILACCPKNGHKTFRHSIMKWRMHAHVKNDPLTLPSPPRGEGKRRENFFSPSPSQPKADPPLTERGEGWGEGERWVAESDLPKYLFSSLWWKALSKKGQ